MPNHIILLNSSAAFSHAWNLSQGNALHNRCFNAMEAFLKGFFGIYTVDIAAAKIYIQKPTKSTYAGTILSKKINSLNIESNIPAVNGLSSYQNNEVLTKKQKENIEKTGSMFDSHGDITGDVKLSNQGIKELPDNLTINGNLSISNCNNFKALPSNLTVTGDIFISECNNFTGLSRGLNVTGDIKIEGCNNFEDLSEDLCALGLYIDSCRNLKTVGNSLNVKRLRIYNCEQLKSLPEQLELEELTLTHCHMLTGTLFNSLFVEKNLEICECSYFEEISNHLIASHVKLDKCYKLNRLAEDMDISRIEITYCPSIASLSSNEVLNINNLKLIDSGNPTADHHYLFRFPKKLTVKETMKLEHCSSIKNLPEFLTVGFLLEIKHM